MECHRVETSVVTEEDVDELASTPVGCGCVVVTALLGLFVTSLLLLIVLYGLAMVMTP